MVDTARNFGGPIPEYYDTILGPAQFHAIAADLVRRVPVRPRGEVLELACGTGILTQRLRERVDPFFRVVATDISEDMLAYARSKVKGKVDWRKADAAALPFKDASFGLAVCGLGVMFVPDKQKLCGEVRRVLLEGGGLIFNVWDRLERNPQGASTARVLEELFPGDAQMQFAQIPYSWSDEAAIRQHLDGARFGDVRIERVKLEIKAPSARAYATGQIRGTPRGALIEQKGRSVDEVIERVAQGLAEVGGAEPFRVEANLLVVQARAV
jgi:ubiquinone/menaquinone biosynthesis C-methylase UbiE